MKTLHLGFAAALAGAVFLAACVPDGSEPEQTFTGHGADYPYEPGSGEPRLSPEDAAACTAAGGIVRVPGLFAGEICVPAAADAGQACTRASDCDGWCMADTGTCSSHVERPGCMEALLNDAGERVLAECVD